MHDIVFKNFTSLDHLCRDVFLSERSENNGVTTKTQKHFIYFVRDHMFLDSQESLGAWVKKYGRKGPRLKSLSVLKSYNSKIGEEKFEVKIVGNIYVLQEQEIFNVDFTQIFKIDRKGESLKGMNK
jgi:hypothetical protein